ncbi:MAG: RNA polymerase sigma factor [Deltaproteobacteria bacterium]|nr:RNA polymerase sigma factor [Deltaproteobacteria bacterium]
MQDDRELYAAWVGGDRAAGSALVERHFASLERFFAHKTYGPVDDLVQQTFLACLEASQDFRGEGSFRAFLFGIARNLLFEHIRRRVRAGREVPDFATSTIADLMPGVSTRLAQESETRQLVLALQRLPLELQTLLELYYWEELSIDELAPIFGVPPGTIKSRLFRARGLLREAMERLPGPEEAQRSARTLLEKWLADVREKIPGEGDHEPSRR